MPSDGFHLGGPNCQAGTSSEESVGLQRRGMSVAVASLGGQGEWLEQQCQPKSRGLQTWYSGSRLAGPGQKGLGKVAVRESRRGCVTPRYLTSRFSLRSRRGLPLRTGRG